MCERRDIKGPLPVRVWVRVRLSGTVSGFPFFDILFSSILSSVILPGIRFGLHRGNPRATTSIYIKFLCSRTINNAHVYTIFRFKNH